MHSSILNQNPSKHIFYQNLHLAPSCTHGTIKFIFCSFKSIAIAFFTVFMESCIVLSNWIIMSLRETYETTEQMLILSKTNIIYQTIENVFKRCVSSATSDKAFKLFFLEKRSSSEKRWYADSCLEDFASTTCINGYQFHLFHNQGAICLKIVRSGINGIPFSAAVIKSNKLATIIQYLSISQSRANFKNYFYYLGAIGSLWFMIVALPAHFLYYLWGHQWSSRDKLDCVTDPFAIWFPHHIFAIYVSVQKRVDVMSCEYIGQPLPVQAPDTF